jgi:DNA polymerase-3 subunit delta'
MNGGAEILHPRDRFTLDHVERQASAVEDAIGRGRLHHAWLFTGPEGLGKASFAFRAARRLLGAKADDRFGPLGADPDDSVCRLISSRSHPDLLVLERSGEGVRRVIPVDEARRLPEFFSKAPALGPYRVAIIDAVDDFNANGANAVLKTLEEPSARGVLFLISHAPGRLLPTIRSRCRTLSFRAWPDATISAFMQEQGFDTADAERIAAMAQGSPGRAMALAQGKALEIDRMALDIVSGAVAFPNPALAGVADGFRGGEGALRFALFVDRLAGAVRQTAKQAEPRAAARWGELWDRLASTPARVEGLNLDRGDAFWSLVRDVAATARAAC